MSVEIKRAIEALLKAATTENCPAGKLMIPVYALDKLCASAGVQRLPAKAAPAELGAMERSLLDDLPIEGAKSVVFFTEDHGYGMHDLNVRIDGKLFQPAIAFQSEEEFQARKPVFEAYAQSRSMQSGAAPVPSDMRLDDMELSLLAGLPLQGAQNPLFRLRSDDEIGMFDLIAEIDGKEYRTGIGFASQAEFSVRKAAFFDYLRGCQMPVQVSYSDVRPAMTLTREVLITPSTLRDDKLQEVERGINGGLIDKVHIVGPLAATGWRIHTHRDVAFKGNPEASPEALQASERIRMIQRAPAPGLQAAKLSM